MISTDTLAARGARATYFWGGSLFLAAGLSALMTLGPLAQYIAPLMGEAAVLLQFAGSALFAAAIIVFAVGSRDGGSAVARKPLGVASLIVLALLPLALWVPSLLPLAVALPPSMTYVTPALQFSAGLIGVILIVTANTVPGWWRWLPLTLFIVYTGLLVAYEAMLRFGPPMDAFAAPYLAVIAPTYILLLGAPFLLGIPAVVLAARARIRTRRVTGAQPPEAAAAPL